MQLLPGHNAPLLVSYQLGAIITVSISGVNGTLLNRVTTPGVPVVGGEWAKNAISPVRAVVTGTPKVTALGSVLARPHIVINQAHLVQNGLNSRPTRRVPG